VASSNIIEPFRNFNFKVDIDGCGEGHFVYCSGVRASVRDIEYREQGAQEYVHHLPGRITYQPMSLKWGVFQGDELWDWFQNIINRNYERRNVTLRILKQDGTDGFRWNLYDAWISEWGGEPLDMQGNEVAIASMSIVYNRVERA
jgi:phage tail-like protein